MSSIVSDIRRAGPGRLNTGPRAAEEGGQRSSGEVAPVQRGDLATTPLPRVLRDLAAAGATGCLRVTAPVGDASARVGASREALVHLGAGRVWAASVPGTPRRLGPRLVTAGLLTPETLAETLRAQADGGGALGELLVRRGLVEERLLAEFAREQLHDALTTVAGWAAGGWRFRRQAIGVGDGEPVEVEHLLAVVEDRRREWEGLLTVVHGPLAVPVLAPNDAGGSLSLRPDSWALLRQVDGRRTLAELAAECGFTHLEAARLAAALVSDGLLEVEADVELEDPPPVPAESDPPPGPVMAIIAALAGTDAAPAGTRPALAAEPGGPGNPVTAALTRVSDALSAAMGPHGVGVPPGPPLPVREKPAPRPRVTEQDIARRARLRQAAAQELARAHAEAEAARSSAAEPEAPQARPEDLAPADDGGGVWADLAADGAVVVDLFSRREAKLAGQSPAASHGRPDEAVANDRPTDGAGPGQSDDHAAAVALLRDLSNGSASRAAADPPPTGPPGGTEPASDAPAPPPAPPPPLAHRDATDTAALLRELSNLGLDDDPADPGPPALRPAHPQPGGSRRRKGLFGRG
jgi:hypothetical protein